MRIKIINGNTFAAMTANIHAQARAAARPDTDIVTVQPKCGPLSIETYYDEYLAIPGILEEIVLDEDSDAFVLACWGDPGIEAARELTTRPVVGIAEASLYVANSLGARFGVVTTLARTGHMVQKTIDKIGLSAHCAKVVCTDLPVTETENARDTSVIIMEQGAREAIAAGAEVIVLGCAGMSGLDQHLEAALGVPVIDSVAAAVVYAEALVQLGKRTSKHMTYKPPEIKHILGYAAHMQPAQLPCKPSSKMAAS